MDAVALGFAHDSIPLVLERDSLHHIAHWHEALAEMIRVSSVHVFLEEPVDDLRSPAKHRAYEAQGLLLELQAEVGYPHHRHLSRDVLVSAVGSRAVLLETHQERSDASVSFDEFFESFHAFASQSAREEYWLERLRQLRARFGGAPLCEDDSVIVLAAKRPA